MHLSKILASDSPPQRRRQQAPQGQSLRQCVMAKRPPAEVEAAQLMLALSCPTVPRYNAQPSAGVSIPSFTSSPNSTSVSPPLSHSFSPNDTPKKGRRTAATRRSVVSPSGQPCPNCGVVTSTLWRTCELNNGSHYLCNACGLRYKKGKYCPLCFRVYYDADTNQLNWQQCQHCLNWTHKLCLQQRNILLTHNMPYICPQCPHSPHRGGSRNSRFVVDPML